MAASHLIIALLLAAAGPPEPVSLTPETIARHGYHLRCVLMDREEKDDAHPTRPGGPAVIRLRFGRLPGTSTKDLEPIKDVSLVVREKGEVQFSVPVRTAVDPGNRVSLYAEFSGQKDLLKKMQLVFEEEGERGRRTFLVDLKPFMEEY